jgi:transposase-like protein
MAKHERSPEAEYFAREEIEKHHKLAHELAVKRAHDEAVAIKAAHWMKCPNCGNDLQTIKLQGVDVKRCFHCHGTFLDEGGLEKLSHAEGPHRIIDAVVNIFKRH